jgi:hypothetical protein
MKTKARKPKTYKSHMKLPKVKSVIDIPSQARAFNCHTHKNSSLESIRHSLPLNNIIRYPSYDSLHYPAFQERQEKQTIRYMKYGEKLSIQSILLQLNKKKFVSP